jgi:pentose-5-phosphate-3-epimerase
MLDNMSLSEMREAVKKISGKVELEASGNVTLETIGKIAETGVDFISSGSLTHSYKSFDIRTLIIREQLNNTIQTHRNQRKQRQKKPEDIISGKRKNHCQMIPVNIKE